MQTNYNKFDSVDAEGPSRVKFYVFTSRRQPEGELTAFTRIVIGAAGGGSGCPEGMLSHLMLQ